MGQPITVAGSTVEGDLGAFHADRSITGQDGTSFETLEKAASSRSYPGDLAVRIFDADAAVAHVFVASNQVVARRDGGWDDSALDAVAEIIAGFFVFYPDA
ncbi:MAG: hypothetical protein V3V29_07750 [Acidimicrobiia bacterium]